MAKKKRPPSKTVRSSKRATIDARSDRVVVHLNARQQAAMKRCLERSGKITLSFGEFSITKLPTVGLPIVPIVTD